LYNININIKDDLRNNPGEYNSQIQMLQLKRTNSENLQFCELVKELDRYLSVSDGDEHAFYAQYNKLDAIKYVIVAYEENEPVGCGAIKEYSNDTMEVKRMYVPPLWRNRGVASAILKELEAWSDELRFKRCILETGSKQVEAIALYKKNHYKIINNFGQYENVTNSVCFEKILDHGA